MRHDYPDSGTRLWDFLGPCTLIDARACMRRARLCSRLAKLTSGRLRRQFYRLKNQNIRAAWFADPSALLITGDMQCHFGLVSVTLQADPSVRVHTHENWLAVA